MHRFYVTSDEACGDEIYLTGREAHHALHVLRLRGGDRVVVLNGAGREISCEIGRHDHDRIRLRVISQRQDLPPACKVTLLQAIPKGKLFEAIVQKATELGVTRIVPILSERVVTRIEEGKSVAKSEKWQLTALEAIKQCGQTWLPEVLPPMTISAFIGKLEQFDLPLVASLQPASRHPRVWFEEFRAAHGRPPAHACIWIGPEGDFTPEEIAEIVSAGARPISLGPLVLRVETAAIYCLSVMHYETQPIS